MSGKQEKFEKDKSEHMQMCFSSFLKWKCENRANDTESMALVLAQTVDQLMICAALMSENGIEVNSNFIKLMGKYVEALKALLDDEEILCMVFKTVKQRVESILAASKLRG